MTISPRRQRTRSALQEAALVVFARRGVAGASIEEICEEGGFTRGAFYSNYATKDELVLAIIDEEFSLAVEGASGLVERLHGEDGEDEASEAGEDGEDEAGEARRTAAAADASTTSDGVATPPEVLRRALEELRFPFSSTPARIIAMKDIELHSLRHPQLRQRLEEVMQSHKALLHTAVSDILTHYGARSTIPLRTLIDICHTCYDAAAAEAVATHPDADAVTVDRDLLLTVLVAFVEFPAACPTRPSDAPD